MHSHKGVLVLNWNGPTVSACQVFLSETLRSSSLSSANNCWKEIAHRSASPIALSSRLKTLALRPRRAEQH